MLIDYSKDNNPLIRRHPRMSSYSREWLAGIAGSIFFLLLSLFASEPALLLVSILWGGGVMAGIKLASITTIFEIYTNRLIVSQGIFGILSPRTRKPIWYYQAASAEIEEWIWNIITKNPVVVVTLKHEQITRKSDLWDNISLSLSQSISNNNPLALQDDARRMQKANQESRLIRVFGLGNPEYMERLREFLVWRIKICQKDENGFLIY